MSDPARSEYRSKAERVEIRLTTAAKSLLGQAARLRHTTISEFMLSSAVAAAEDALATPKVFFADGAAWKSVMDMLAADGSDIPEAVVQRIARARRTE